MFSEPEAKSQAMNSGELSSCSFTMIPSTKTSQKLAMMGFRKSLLVSLAAITALPPREMNSCMTLISLSLNGS